MLTFFLTFNSISTRIDKVFKGDYNDEFVCKVPRMAKIK